MAEIASLPPPPPTFAIFTLSVYSSFIPTDYPPIFGAMSFSFRKAKQPPHDGRGSRMITKTKRRFAAPDETLAFEDGKENRNGVYHLKRAYLSLCNCSLAEFSV
ncbi:MAG: hypothetical protein ACTTKL_03320 [Treponema sp.]